MEGLKNNHGAIKVSSVLKEAIKALESLSCQECSGDGCPSCSGSGFKRDADDTANQILEITLDNIRITCKHYLEMNAPRHKLVELFSKFKL